MTDADDISVERVEQTGEDAHRQETLGGTDIYRPEWADSEDVTKWVERNLLTGTVLNFPCGASRLGDVRVDIDPSVDPDIRADLRDPPFEDDSFATVYCDPPYSMHAFDKVQWALDLWDIAKRRLILQTTTEVYRFSNSTRRVYLADKKQARCFQVFQVFDRESEHLGDFARTES